MKIRDILRTKGTATHTVNSTEKVSDVLGRFADSKIRSLVVTEGDTLTGILTIRDVVAWLDTKGAAALDAAVGDAMTTDVVSIGPEADVEEAERIFTEHHFQHLPVVEDGELVGLVTPTDILGRHLEEEQETSNLMLAYCTGAYY